jgi:hypothetical protein
MVVRARKLAAQSENVAAVWQATLGRNPTAKEKALAERFLAERADDAALPPGPLALVPETAGQVPEGRFHENTIHERVLVRNAPKEGDEFTVEAIFTPESVDAAAAVRTIVSRWSGDKNSLEAHGWSLGLTGRKSAHKPLNLILQLVGEDRNMNTSYEVVPSGIFLKLKTPHHVAAKVSCHDGTVTFFVQELSGSDVRPQRSTVKHSIVGKLGIGQATPVIGGIFRRSAHQFDGEIRAVRIASGLLPDDALSGEPTRWTTSGMMVWEAKRASAPGFEWSGGASVAESVNPRARAMAELCHVLLNSNEFVHLH